MPRASNPNRGGKREPGPGKRHGLAPAVAGEPAIINVSGMVSPSEFKQMETIRGQAPRSAWIRQAIVAAIKAVQGVEQS